MSTQITLEVNETAIAFDVDIEDYNAYTNAMLPNNKVAPSHNFLMRTVVKENKETLSEMLKNTPGLAVLLASHLVNEYAPEVTIVVKK